MGATWHFLSWLSWSRRTPNASIGALKRSGSELSFLNANDTEEPHEDGDGFGGSALVSKTGGEGDDTMPEITPLPW